MSPSGPFTVALGTGVHWGAAAKACLNGIAGAAPSANLGLLYATEDFAEHLPSILTFLRETTRITHWVGAAVPGLCVGDQECRSGGALAVMVGALPAESFATFAGGADLEGDRAVGCTALVHGDPQNPAMSMVFAALAGQARRTVGGLVAGAAAPSQIAGSVTAAPLSGLLLDPAVPVVTGLTQGCSPIGPEHVVTEAWQGVVMHLDGRPALDVLKDEAGELFARDVRRAAGYIHVALPASDGDGHSYQVRSLVDIDQRQGWLAVGERMAPGQRLMLVRRDANGARADLRRMLAGVRTQLAGRRPLAALYVSCVARGAHMFGAEGAESALVQDALEGAPLLGFFANGEIAGGRLFSYTGVLAVIAGAEP